MLGVGGWEFTRALLYQAYNHSRQIFTDARRGRSPFRRALPDTDLIEFMCENEKDYVHMVGK